MTVNTTNERKYLTIEEQQELIKMASQFPRHKLIVLLLMHGGLRVSEAISIKVSDIDFRNKVLNIKTLKKRKIAHRTIPMSIPLYDEIMNYISSQNIKSDDYLLCHGGKPIGRHSVNRFLKKYENQSDLLAGTNIHPHKLRHTFATMLRSNEAKVEDIKDALGHENIQTTLVYAHQDPNKMKELVRVSTAPSIKISLFQRIKNSLKAKPVRKIPIKSISTENILIGRKKEKERIITLLSKKVNTIILGGTGTGKSHLLEESLNSFPGKVLEFDNTQNLKKQLITTILYLLSNDKEQLKEIMFKDTEEDSIRVKISKESTINLAKILSQITTYKEYVLSFNDMDNINIQSVKVLQQLVEHFVIIGTARNIPMNKSDFLWDFEKVEIENLKRSDAMGLIYRLGVSLGADDFGHLKTAIYEASSGNPRMIVQLINRLAKEEKIDTDTVNEITEVYIGREVKQIDMSIYLLLLFGGLAVFRYLSGEVGNESLRFIGGCSMIFVLFARHFFNGFKRKTL